MDRRLYTPPTCTLMVETPTNWLSKISRKSEPLSLASLDNIKFVLSFDDPRQTVDGVTVKGDLLDRLRGEVNTYVQNFLASPPQLGSPASKTPPNSGIPRLQQQDFLTHTLYWGQLPQTTVAKIDLTTTQLFDLATALDAYTEELDIPTPANYWWKSKWFASWGLGATAIFLFMGLTSLGFQLLQARNSANSAPETPLPSRNNSVTSDLQIFPTPKVSIPPLPKVSPLGANQKLSLPAPVSAPPSSIAPSTPLIVPNERGRNSSPIFSDQDQMNPLDNNSGNNSANNGATPLTSPRPGRNQGSNPAPVASQNPSLTPVSPLPELPALNPETVIEIPPQEVPPIRVNEDLNIDYRNYRNYPNQVNQVNQSSQRGESLFDRIPQVPEVRKYFQSRWQPPLGLNQVLEYSILLNSNGTIARVIPLGQAATANIDRLGMPSLNAPFVSPIAQGGKPKIRVILTPEGEVETFLESIN
jgi:hypothetical protein